MNTRLRVYALHLLKLWHSAADPGNSWHNQKTCQAYQDSMEALIHCRLIEDYSVNPVKVKIGGNWHS